MHSNPCCKAALFSGDTVQSPSPSVSSLTAPGTSRLQFTVPPSMYWVINYAILPRMGMQTKRQTIKRDRHLLLLFMRSPRSAFLQLCLARQLQQIPGLSIFSSTQGNATTSRLGSPPRLIAGSSPSWVPAAGAVAALAPRRTGGHRMDF